jgi:hypothetical protein
MAPIHNNYDRPNNDGKRKSSRMDLVSNHVGHKYAKVVYAGSPAALTDYGSCGAMYLRALDGIYIGTAPDPPDVVHRGGYRDGANAYTVLIYRSSTTRKAPSCNPGESVPAIGFPGARSGG